MPDSLIQRILDGGDEQYVLTRTEIRRIFAKWTQLTKDEPETFDVVPEQSTDANYADRQAEYFIRIHEGKE